MSSQPQLSPGEWAVLGALAEGPTHGFALARLLGPEGDLGKIWTMRRPVVYQALRKLTALDLVAAQSTQRSDQGPHRTIVALTPSGRRSVAEWLETPVAHVRDARSELLLKLALLGRAGREQLPLVEAQRELFGARRAQLQGQRDAATGFERVLAEWRLASLDAVLGFLDALRAPACKPEGPGG